MSDSNEKQQSNYQLKRANFFYSVQFLVWGIVCLVMKAVPNEWLIKVTNIEGNYSHEIAFSFSSRISISLLVWFLLHSAFMLRNKNLVDSVQYIIHTSYLIIHQVLLVALIVGSMWLPENFVIFYFYISVIISCFFLLFQLVSLIDFFFDLNDYILDAHIILGYIFLGILVIIWIGLFVCCYIFFRCTIARWMTSLNLILTIILVAAGVIHENQSAITASFVAAYVSYLTFSGLNSDSSCNEFSSTSSNVVFLIMSALFSITWLVYSTYSLSKQFNIFVCECSENNEEEENQFNLSFFHFVYAISACYLFMVVSNWGNTQQNSIWKTNRGEYAKWTTLSCSWICVLLFVWIMIAPKICPNRVFQESP